MATDYIIISKKNYFQAWLYYASCHHANQPDVYWRIGCYLLGCTLVKKNVFLDIPRMDHSLEAINFHDPIDGSLLDVSIQEEVAGHK